MSNSPEELIRGLIGISIESLQLLRVAISNRSSKSRYRLLDPSNKHGVNEALDCYSQVFTEFPVAIAGHKATRHALEQLNDGWNELFDTIAEELDASSTCEDARTALHALHKKFIATLLDPTTKPAGEFYTAKDVLTALSKEMHQHILSASATGQATIKIIDPSLKLPDEFDAASKSVKLGWTDKLQSEFEHECEEYEKDEKCIESNIHRIHLSSLDYVHRIFEWMPYLRGEDENRPSDFVCGDKKKRNVGEWILVTIKPCILDPAYQLMRNLPKINTVKHPYPIQKLTEMFDRITLMLTAMGLCEEERYSKEGSEIGTAAIKAHDLRMLICPKPNTKGRYILESSRIPKAFGDFFATLCNAAWAIGDKVHKRDKGEIDLDTEMAKLKDREIKSPAKKADNGTTDSKPTIPESNFKKRISRFRFTEDTRNAIDDEHRQPIYKIDPYTGLTQNAADIIQILVAEAGNKATEGWVKSAPHWRGRFQGSNKAAWRFKREQIELGRQNTEHQGEWRIIPDALFIEHYRKIMFGRFNCKM